MLPQITADLATLGSASSLATLGQILLVDLALAGDNAVVIGTIAAGLHERHRRWVIVGGVVLALVIRIALALVATRLLGIPWLMPLGGLLLLWVAWRLARDLYRDRGEDAASARAPASVPAAILAIAVADASMSLDNVLAIAAIARAHPGLLALGLVVSVALMGVGAGIVSRLIGRYRWIGWAGAAVILLVALRLLREGVAAL